MIGRVPQQPSVLLLSSNGTGMGHLSRLLAYARAMPEGTRRHVVSLSQAVPAVGAAGLSWEYLPSHGSTGQRSALWRRMFADRMTEILGRVRPDVLVFDGTHPYRGLDEALAAHPHVKAVWSRRAMWKPGRNDHQLPKADWFDLVLEPGDLSAAADRGETVTDTAAHRVRPVTLLNPEELSNRAQARAALGLPADGPLALINLGAGTINDTSADVGAAVAAVRVAGIGVCLTSAPIADPDRPVPDEVHVVRHFPLSQYYRAFDYVIAAAGYNSFHEALRFGVPAILVPNPQTSLDDQTARSEYAARSGWALNATTLADGRAEQVVAELLRRGPELAASAQAADPGNGAADAAAAILTVAGVAQ